MQADCTLLETGASLYPVLAAKCFSLSARDQAMMSFLNFPRFKVGSRTESQLHRILY